MSEPVNSQSHETMPAKPPPGPLSGKLGIFVCLALFAAAAYLAYNAFFVAPPAQADPPPSTFFCIESKKPFEHKLQQGERIPVLSPHTNRKTGYPAEKCYWTKDGKRKATPTYVVLNEYLKRSDERTLCPDCGRVIRHGFPPPPADTPLAGESASDASTATQPVTP